MKSLNSYHEAKDLINATINDQKNGTNRCSYYRGQSKDTNELVPNIIRKTKLNLKKREHQLLKNLRAKSKILNLHSEALFTEKQNDWNLLIQAQHLGRKTRLLDWTLKWEIALWFAVENECHHDKNGSFFIFNCPNEIVIDNTERKGNFFKKDLDNLQETYLINAPTYSSNNLNSQKQMLRQMRQWGVFTISPFEQVEIPLNKQLHLIDYFEEYKIPSMHKADIKSELEKNGFDRKFIFP